LDMWKVGDKLVSNHTFVIKFKIYLAGKLWFPIFV
jgi:hypothetical protein